jgi:hypothetical protein
MTRTEEKEMAELHMTEEQLEERRRRLAASGAIGHVNCQTRPVVAAVEDLPPAHEPKAEDTTFAAPEPEKKSRLSVAKLLARYQDRVDSIAEQIDHVTKAITVQQALICELQQHAEFWREAISEIERD